MLMIIILLLLLLLILLLLLGATPKVFINGLMDEEFRAGDGKAAALSAILSLRQFKET